ncbi:MAG: hypothetical protein K0R77_2127 [Chryseobacterium sp.]|jgi:hypothetical protein|uniref:hypothetical protein n=1 Tax=Chryseobacterium sp. TaxID=1871047 RepID=UPI002612383E|nr:hypothetical protein [Chryseobacterium sp.]MDF2552852.1 hypothetical protein [Chryseobacterium sp.]
MKKTLLFFAVIISSILFSQYRFDEKYFIGENLDLLKGKTLIPLPIEDQLKEFGYDNFYNSEKLELRDVYKSKNGYSKSNYDDVYNKKFIVEDFSKTSNIFGDYILKLKDEESRNVYFLYSSTKPSKFPFKVDGEFNLPSDFYCSKIDVRKDKFTGKIVKYSPLLDPVAFTKDNGYYLSLKTYGSTPVVDGTGVIILLTNGQKIKKNTKIDVEVSDSGNYEYSAFIPLNKNDIALLSKYVVDDFKLYIFENTQKLNGEIYKEYLKCIIK